MDKLWIIEDKRKENLYGTSPVQCLSKYNKTLKQVWTSLFKLNVNVPVEYII